MERAEPLDHARIGRARCGPGRRLPHPPRIVDSGRRRRLPHPAFLVARCIGGSPWLPLAARRRSPSPLSHAFQSHRRFQSLMALAAKAGSSSSHTPFEARRRRPAHHRCRFAALYFCKKNTISATTKNKNSQLKQNFSQFQQKNCRFQQNHRPSSTDCCKIFGR